MSKVLENDGSDHGVLVASGEPPLSHEEWLEKQAEAEAERQKEAQARAKARTRKGAAAAEDSGGGEDPVDGIPAPEAIEKIGNMRSRERLQAIADNDKRATVKKAAEDRLAALGE